MKDGLMKTISSILAGQSCCSALNSWAARQHRPTEGAKMVYPFAFLFRADKNDAAGKLEL
jgi:hypothetical protein